MKKLAAIVLSAALALGAVSASTHEAEARSGRNTALAVGVIAGLVLGGAVATARQRDPAFFEGRTWRRHVRWCHNRYRSYNARTNQFLSYSGRYRYCRSPYIR